MANLKIDELQSAGTELFEDSESFLNELNSNELANAVGGYGYGRRRHGGYGHGGHRHGGYGYGRRW
ncbi:hypothetical protein [Cylindrospermum stagnale]|nr:hypothetical protein [Cylindrospermum stagnale]